MMNSFHKTKTQAPKASLKVKSAFEQLTHQAGAYPIFCGMKRQGVFLLPLDGMLVHRRVIPPAVNSTVPIYKPE